MTTPNTQGWDQALQAATANYNPLPLSVLLGAPPGAEDAVSTQVKEGPSLLPSSLSKG